jgi:hypothetical protein
MEQAGEVDYLITWRDEFVGRVSLTPCRRAGANRRPHRLKLGTHRRAEAVAGSRAGKPVRWAGPTAQVPFPGKCAGRREATRPFEIRILDSPGSLDDGSGDG